MHFRVCMLVHSLSLPITEKAVSDKESNCYHAINQEHADRVNFPGSGAQCL